MFPVRAVAATTGKAGPAAFGAAPADLPPALVGHKKYAHRASTSGTISHSQRPRGRLVFLDRALCAAAGVTEAGAGGSAPGARISLGSSVGVPGLLDISFIARLRRRPV